MQQACKPSILATYEGFPNRKAMVFHLLHLLLYLMTDLLQSIF